MYDLGGAGLRAEIAHLLCRPLRAYKVLIGELFVLRVWGGESGRVLPRKAVAACGRGVVWVCF